MTKFVELAGFYQAIDRVPEAVQSEVGHFNIFKVEDLLLPRQKPVTYSRRNFFKISLVTGHSKIYYADQCIEVRDSVLVFTNPMIPYFWERISQKHSGYVCIFTEDFFNRFANIRDYPVFQLSDAAIVPLPAGDLPFYEDLFLRMFNELQGSYTYKYDLLRNLLMEVIHGAQKMQPASGSPLADSNAAERITGLFAELLERQFPIELSNQVIRLNTPSAFAGQLHIHTNHLNKVLKETTGRTTFQLINDRVLQEAKILLKSTNWTVNEIAWSLGFQEPNHFSGFFKRGTGSTPKSFRKAEEKGAGKDGRTEKNEIGKDGTGKKGAEKNGMTKNGSGTRGAGNRGAKEGGAGRIGRNEMERKGMKKKPEKMEKKSGRMAEGPKRMETKPEKMEKEKTEKTPGRARKNERT